MVGLIDVANVGRILRDGFWSGQVFSSSARPPRAHLDTAMACKVGTARCAGKCLTCPRRSRHGVPALAGCATERKAGRAWPGNQPAKAGTPCRDGRPLSLLESAPAALRLAAFEPERGFTPGPARGRVAL